MTPCALCGRQGPAAALGPLHSLPQVGQRPLPRPPPAAPARLTCSWTETGEWAVPARACDQIPRARGCRLCAAPHRLGEASEAPRMRDTPRSRYTWWGCRTPSKKPSLRTVPTGCGAGSRCAHPLWAWPHLQAPDLYTAFCTSRPITTQFQENW